MATDFKPYFTNCRSCKAHIAMIGTTKGKVAPVNVESLTPQEKEDIEKGINFFFDNKKHMNHFATCPDAKRYRKNGK